MGTTEATKEHMVAMNVQGMDETNNRVSKGDIDAECGRLRGVDMVLRLIGGLLCLAGALVMAKDHQEVTVMVGTVPLTIVARHSYARALVFYVYANGILAVYCFLSMLLIFSRSRNRSMAILLFSFDQVMAYLLLATAAAATEVSYIAKQGEDKILWTEVCSNFHRFCNLVGVCLVLSFLGTLCMAALAILSARRVFRLPCSS